MIKKLLVISLLLFASQTLLAEDLDSYCVPQKKDKTDALKDLKGIFQSDKNFKERIQLAQQQWGAIQAHYHHCQKGDWIKVDSDDAIALCDFSITPASASRWNLCRYRGQTRYFRKAGDQEKTSAPATPTTSSNTNI